MENIDLSIFFQTRTQAADFSKGLTYIIESLYKTDFQLEKVLLEQFGLQKKDVFLTFLRKNNVATDTVAPLKEFLTKMQEYIHALPTLSLTIAFEPKEETLRAISQWFVGQLHKQILLEITVNPAIIAGTAITFRGKYLDYSIQSIFDKAVSEILTPTALQNSSQIQSVTLTKQQSTEDITLGR